MSDDMQNKPVIHFAHANGFPAASYQKVFSYLEPQFNIIALDKFAHNPQYPVKMGWQHQVDEMLEFIQSQTKQPVYAVGHSFGAVISYMAVCQYPEYFRGLILLDPPLITGVTGIVAKALRPTPLFDRFTPAKQAVNRCTQWPKGTDLVDYFANKALFRNMHIECVQDYVAAATEADETGHKLTFDHRVEANIFRTIPLDIHRYYGRLKRPALLLTGEFTQVCLPRLIRPFVDGNGLTHEIVPKGGHMFPLEQPQHVASCIDVQINQWLTEESQVTA